MMQIDKLQDSIKTLTDKNLQLEAHIAMVQEYVYATKTDTKGVLTEVSNSFCSLSGYSREDLIGFKHSVVRHPKNSDSFYANLWETISSGNKWEGDVRNKSKDGSEFWMDTLIFPIYDGDENIIGYSSMRRNITINKKLLLQLNMDMLTGLYNRRYYEEVLEAELINTRKNHRSIAYAMMDIDNFKRYNDTYGHRGGDQVLKKIGALLHQKLNENGQYAFRMGGEEFALLLLGLTNEEAIDTIENLRTSILELQIEHLNNTASNFVSASFGLVYIDTEHTIVDENALYSAADNALYEAKSLGRNRLYVHEINEIEFFS